MDDSARPWAIAVAVLPLAWLVYVIVRDRHKLRRPTPEESAALRARIARVEPERAPVVHRPDPILDAISSFFSAALALLVFALVVAGIIGLVWWAFSVHFGLGLAVLAAVVVLTIGSAVG